MHKEPRSFWSNWLLAAVVGVELFSIAMLLPGWPAQRFFAWLLLDGQAITDPVAASYIAILYAVVGAVMLGWMAALVGVILVPFRRGEAWAWLTISGSLAIWYLIDSVLSVVLGYPLNAVSNSGFLFLFIVPLAATFRTFFPAEERRQVRA
ncbi:MAG: hypothetical protein HC822_12230 [Oscillochloris sp.]|nr:hypothetical protein [Oscillochloris sp.]